MTEYNKNQQSSENNSRMIILSENGYVYGISYTNSLQYFLKQQNNSIRRSVQLWKCVFTSTIPKTSWTDGFKGSWKFLNPNKTSF